MTREELRAELLSPRETLAALKVSYLTVMAWRANGYLVPIIATPNACIYWRRDVERVQAEYTPPRRGRDGRFKRGPLLKRKAVAK